MAITRSQSGLPQPAKRHKLRHRVVDDGSEDEKADCCKHGSLDSPAEPSNGSPVKLAEPLSKTVEALDSVSESGVTEALDSVSGSNISSVQDTLEAAGAFNSVPEPNNEGTQGVPLPGDERETFIEVLLQQEQDDASNEDLEDYAQDASLSDAWNSSMPTKYLSHDEVVERKQHENGPFRKIPGAIHPPSKDEQQRVEYAPPGSNVYKFGQIFHHFACVYFEAFRESRFQPVQRDLFAQSRVEEMERSNLKQHEIIEAALNGIPEVVQNHYGSDNPFDNEAILANFPHGDKAFYQGGYIGVASWEDDNHDNTVAVYHGQTTATITGRLATHKDNIALRLRSKQLVSEVFREAENRGGRCDFRVTHIHHDETPRAVITLCEMFFMVCFGHVQHLKDPRGKVKCQTWLDKLRGDLEGPPEEWVTVNGRIPTREASRQIPRNCVDRAKKYSMFAQLPHSKGVKCWICGNSRELARDHGFKLDLYTKMGLVWCELCRNLWSREENIRPMYVWQQYLWPSTPQCFTCKDDDGGRLKFRLFITEWDELFGCLKCNVYSRGVKSEGPTRPEEYWQPHLRRLLRCENCGDVESPGALFHVTHAKGKYILCHACRALVRNDRHLPEKINMRNYPKWAQGNARAAVAPPSVPYVVKKGAKLTPL